MWDTECKHEIKLFLSEVCHPGCVFKLHGEVNSVKKDNYKYMAKWCCSLPMEKLRVSAETCGFSIANKNHHLAIYLLLCFWLNLPRRKTIPLQPFGLQDFEAVRISKPLAHKRGSWSALPTGRLYPLRNIQRYSEYLFLLQSESTPQPICCPKDCVYERESVIVI